MATKKDLVEAHSFSRRRLVTAFLSGAPGGREVEPSRPGRAIVGGIALSVLLIAGAAIASVLAARTPADWNKEGVISAQDNDGLYVILKEQANPVLLPILNVTSAQLIFGANTAFTTVSSDTINQQIPGPTIGILGAPPTLPKTGSLLQSGWTACTGDSLGIQVDVSQTPQVQSGSGYAVTVRTPDGAVYLVTDGAEDNGRRRARYYAAPDLPGIDDMLGDFGANQREEAMDVPSEWLNLLQEGGELSFDSFGFDGTGPAPAALRGTGVKVGQYVVDPDSGIGRAVTPEGTLRLSPFALTVYRNSVLPGTNAAPQPVDDADAGALDVLSDTSDTEQGAFWPEDVPTRGTPQQACAVLDAVSGEPPAVRLGVDPTEDASAADVAPTEKVVSVDPGKGAFYVTGSFDESTSDTRWILNSQGRAYSLVDEASVEALGYDKLKDPAPLVPAQWNELFVRGVNLSTTAALCPPVENDDDDTVDQDQTCESPASAGAEAGAGAAG